MHSSLLVYFDSSWGSIKDIFRFLSSEKAKSPEKEVQQIDFRSVLNKGKGKTPSPEPAPTQDTPPVTKPKKKWTPPAPSQPPAKAPAPDLPAPRKQPAWKKPAATTPAAATTAVVASEVAGERASVGSNSSDSGSGIFSPPVPAKLPLAGQKYNVSLMCCTRFSHLFH